jgi:hypothetical protein
MLLIVMLKIKTVCWSRFARINRIVSLLDLKKTTHSPFDINFSPLLSIERSLLLSRSFWQIETVTKNVLLLVKGERGITMAK